MFGGFQRFRRYTLEKGFKILCILDSFHCFRCFEGFNAFVGFVFCFEFASFTYHGLKGFDSFECVQCKSTGTASPHPPPLESRISSKSRGGGFSL